MARGKITKRSVDAICPGNQDGYLWDDELAGFGLKVTPTGRKTYLIQYRLGGRRGRTRRVTIGKHGVVTADQARTEAKRLLGEVAAGNDPAETRDKANAEKTVHELLERFLTEHVDAKLRRRTIEEYRRTSKIDILPKLGPRRMNDIGRTDIARIHHALKDKPSQANRVLAILSKFFNWTEKHGFRQDGTNPCRHIQKYPEKKRERFLSQEELSGLGDALKVAEDKKTASPWIIAAIRLLMLTGARLSEVLTLKWEWIDFERAQIRLPDSKTGAKTIYLNAPALEVLANVPQLESNPYVICGDKKDAHLVNLQKPWRRIRKAAGLEDVRLHDLRHSFASVAAAGGMSLPIIGALLGHTQSQTTQRYAHLSADPLRAASNTIGKRIETALNTNSNKPLLKSIIAKT